MGTTKANDLDRFIEAQEKEYEIAYKEISQGKKQSHWIWYIYPQIKGLGMSYMDKEYSIKSIKEARDYVKNEKLYNNLIEMTELLLEIKHNDIKEVMWYPDDLKLRSCMTLFYAISGNDIFEKVIDKFYEGEKDMRTINILNKMFIDERKTLNKKFCEQFEKRINKIEKEEKIKIEKRVKLEKELKKEELWKKKHEKEMKLQEEKEKENEKKLDDNDINKNKKELIPQTKENKKEEKEKEANKEIKENKEEIKDNKENKGEENIKDNKNNIEYNNRIDNKDLCSSEPMDLDEESIRSINKVSINNINTDKNNLMKDKLINEEQEKEPKDNNRNSKETKIDKEKEEEKEKKNT